MIIVRLGEVRERTVVSSSGICRDNLSKKTSVSAIVKSSLQDYSHLEEDRLLFLDSVWGPPVISWFISSSNYSYKYHKPYRFEILRHWKHRLDPFPSYKWLRSDPSTFILQHFLGDSTRSLPSNRQRGQRECFQGRWWSLEVSHGAQAKDIKI